MKKTERLYAFKANRNITLSIVVKTAEIPIAVEEAFRKEISSFPGCDSVLSFLQQWEQIS